MTTTAGPDGSAWGEHYEQVRPTYKRYAEELAHLLRIRLSTTDIKLHEIEHREKSSVGFLEKIARPGKTYRDPLREIPDLAGVRVILYQIDDVYRVIDLCHDLFIVWEDDERLPFASPSDFGYESAHIVVGLTDERGNLAEWQPFRGLRAEIQVRTLLQHAWATTSHALEYKQETDVPVGLRRQLSRISALLELADSEFSAIAHQHSDLRRALAEEAAERPTSWDSDIDAASLAVFVRTEPEMQVIRQEALEAGFSLDARGYLSSLSELGRWCRRLSIERVSGLRTAITPSRTARTEFFRLAYEFYSRPWSVDEPFLVVMLLVRAYEESLTADDFIQVSAEWDYKNAEVLLKAARTSDGNSRASDGSQ